MYDVHRTLLSRDQQVRVEVYRRTNGTFGFRVFNWHIGETEGPHWCMQGGHSESITASVDDAEREVRARVTGMADASAVVGIERVGRDDVSQRDLFVLNAATVTDVPSRFSLSSKSFVCLLVWDALTATVDEISSVARKLLDGGAVYIAIWGQDCSRVHDIIDEEFVGPNPTGAESPVVITTWHEREELADAIRFVLVAAVPDDGFQADCACTLAIAIGSSTAAVQIRKAFESPEDFVRELDLRD